MQATRMLPPNHRQKVPLDLSKSKGAIVGAIVFGIMLLFAAAWLLMQFTRFLCPAALEYIGFGDLLTTTPDGHVSITLPVVDLVVALILVMVIHEFHGALFWRFAGQRPMFGVKGLFVYAAAPPRVYFPRNQYLVVGMAPLVLLTLVGLLLMLIVPVIAVHILSLFIVFNVAGAAGDLVMTVRLLSYSLDTLIQDSDTGVMVYGSGEAGTQPNGV
ncbi:MAG: DUF3267 domain-containing protein [Anaerolineae bacterium]